MKGKYLIYATFSPFVFTCIETSLNLNTLNLLPEQVPVFVSKMYLGITKVCTKVLHKMFFIIMPFSIAGMMNNQYGNMGGKLYL